MTKTVTRIIVIGTSAGGLNALLRLFAQLPEDFPAPILLVQHISQDATGNRLLEVLSRSSKLNFVHGENGIRPAPGSVYIAPSDHHLMLDENHKLLVTKGAHENRSRPAIDPLFRSVAVVKGAAVIGILLTGYLDDGTAGMKVIEQCGGTTIVQDPEEAQYPDMPQNAIDHVKIDHVVPVPEMGALLYKLLGEELRQSKPVPKDIAIEATIAQRVLSDLPAVNALGSQVPFNCPGCGGVLWEVKEDEDMRFRCHVGHAYTSAALLADQTHKIEETMWTALRMFEERKNLLLKMAKDLKGSNSKLLLERAELSQIHIDRIRATLQSDDKGTSGDIPT